MNRRGFLKNLLGIVAASAIPAVVKDITPVLPPVPHEMYKGLLWQIQHGGNTITYKGSLSIEMLEELFRNFETQKRKVNIYIGENFKF